MISALKLLSHAKPQLVFPCLCLLCYLRMFCCHTCPLKICKSGVCSELMLALGSATVCSALCTLHSAREMHNAPALQWCTAIARSDAHQHAAWQPKNARFVTVFVTMLLFAALRWCWAVKSGLCPTLSLACQPGSLFVCTQLYQQNHRLCMLCVLPMTTGSPCLTVQAKRLVLLIGARAERESPGASNTGTPPSRTPIVDHEESLQMRIPCAERNPIARRGVLGCVV